MSYLAALMFLVVVTSVLASAGVVATPAWLAWVVGSAVASGLVVAFVALARA